MDYDALYGLCVIAKDSPRIKRAFGPLPSLSLVTSSPVPPIPLALSFCEKAPEVWLIQLKYAERCAALALLAKLANTGNAVKGTDRLTGDRTFNSQSLGL